KDTSPGKGFGPKKDGGPPAGALFVPRGRQSPFALSPDGQYKAFYRDRNLWLADAKGVIEMPVTTDGSEKDRVKNGSASWVYGKPFDNDSIGHYVYRVSWSPDGSELLVNRTNRRQNVMQFVAADPATGKCRVIVHEEWPASWVENLPAMRLLKDNKRFVWAS